ncbi:hypothetical protein DPMN_075604 [Dreissena polymorpha]|uniref:Uncharacterized protein n=1 Tax=Dreissena polymorpha TaxID=45954 RepID=A0A9D3YH50_DREPO|nr:hypothetical protein DPMN_075604 [Dreissena polymorpha]
MDPELEGSTAVHVTPIGQVLLCDGDSHTILQVDNIGCRKLATLATKRDGINGPISVCYNSNTDTIIVGQWDNNTIFVCKVK